MVENLTREHKLVEEISAQGWFTNPAGRHGYEVIVLEQVGSGGNRFYCSLKPGETLRIAERLFGNYTLLAVDIRHARSVPVTGDFTTFDRGRKVTVRANIRYRVTEARVVAMDTVDPLGELRDKVTATLHREMVRHREANIDPGTIEQIIRSVGPVPHLGLTVEDAEILEFTSDSRLTQHTLEEENLRHQLEIEDMRSRASLEAESRQDAAALERDSRRQEADLRWRQERHEAIDLSDINALMHEHPEMIGQIFNTFEARKQRLLETRLDMVKPAIQAYIEQQQEIDGEIDPDEIERIMSKFTGPRTPQIQSSVGGDRLRWGDDEPGTETKEPRVTFSDKDQKKPGKSKKPPSDSRIKFGD